VHGPVRRRRSAGAPGSRHGESELLILGAPHAAYRSLNVGGKDVVDVWGVLGAGIQL
jgi:hypothetical protein